MSGCQQIALVCLCLVLCTYSLSVEGRTVNTPKRADIDGFPSEDSGSPVIEKRSIQSRHMARMEFCILNRFHARCRRGPKSSMNNPNFPVSQGERRVEDPQLSRISKTAHMSSPSQLPITHPATYQVTKTLTRQIAPAPGAQVLSGIGKPVPGHQISGLNPAVHKKEIQKTALSLTSTTPVTTLPAGAGVIPVQIGGTATSSTVGHASSLHVPNVSSIVRGALPGSAPHPTGFSHLPRGVVAASAQVRAGSTVSIQRQTLPTSIQMPAHSSALSLQGQIRNLPQMMRPGTPPTNRSGSPAISLGSAQPTESHRSSISLHNVTSANTPSIQITLQAPRTGSETAGKATTTYQPGKVHVNPGLNTTQPKVVMSHAISPVMQHPTLAAKGNRGQPMSTVTVALSTTTVTIPIISTGTTSSSIPIGSTPPIAKVLPQRQLQQAQSHVLPTTLASSLEHRTEPSSYPQPMPAHSHAQAPTTQASVPQPQAHSQSTTSLFIPQPHRGAGSSTVISTVASNVSHSEQRETSLPAMPFLPYMCMSPENPYYHQLMRTYVETAQAHALARPGLISTQTSANIAASLQAASTHSATQPTGANVRFHNPMMVVPESLRQAAAASQNAPQSSHPQLHTTSAEAGTTKLTTSSMDAVAPSPVISSQATHSSGISVAVAGVASSLYTATTQPSHMPQIGQPAPNTPSSAPVNNPSASPRPSILRKRTNEGVSAVKKQLAMSSVEVHSPRPEPRPDSTPQSNMSSPKTPASGESQSSTDTALSSEATTPTQPRGDKVKTEPPEPHENGYPCNTPEASPRKRRKQLLQATEEIRDTPVNVFDKFVEACIKEDDEDFDDDGSLSEEEEKYDLKEEYVDEEGIRWTLEKCRPNVSLLNFYNISWKPRNNHFVRYSDVKAKDERRPTVNELSNQKGVLQKASGWKLYHMAAQIEDLVELEGELNSKIASLQASLAPQPPTKHSLVEDESGMLHELTQGNIQRCKLITDQLGEAKSTMLKVLEHKPKISEIITKHMSKRPIKKKERT